MLCMLCYEFLGPWNFFLLFLSIAMYGCKCNIFYVILSGYRNVRKEMMPDRIVKKVQWYHECHSHGMNWLGGIEWKPGNVIVVSVSFYWFIAEIIRFCCFDRTSRHLCSHKTYIKILCNEYDRKRGGLRDIYYYLLLFIIIIYLLFNIMHLFRLYLW